MIPARQPQPRRCVLTMHEVQSIKDLVFVVGGNSESSAQKAIFEIISDGIRKATATHTSPQAPAPELDAMIKQQKLRMRQLFLDDAKCELCEKVTEEDGYDGQSEGCEKGLCIECAIDKSLREFAESLRSQERGPGAEK